MYINVPTIRSFPWSAWMKRRGSSSRRLAPRFRAKGDAWNVTTMNTNDAASIPSFMASEPLAGKRLVKATERKTRFDWAEFIKDLAGHYKKAKKIILVMDNLSTHKAGSLYETFPPEEAKRLRERFEFVYTPTHGSWLNMAEIELNVMIRQCLSGRMDSLDKAATAIARLAAPSRQLEGKGLLAVHNPRCEDQAQAALSDIRDVT